MSACRRRVAALMVQFPPCGGGVIGRQVAPRSSCSSTPPFGGALDERRFAQNADHRTYKSPFSTFFTEVVYVLGTTPS